MLGRHNLSPPNAEDHLEVRMEGSGWRRVVSDFKKREMTYAAAGLPAVSGMAKKIHEATQRTYPAGCWMEDLFNDLLWVALDLNGHRFRLPLLHWAPSWSWVSMLSGQVTYGHSFYSQPIEGRSPLVKLLSVPKIEYFGT